MATVCDQVKPPAQIQIPEIVELLNTCKMSYQDQFVTLLTVAIVINPFFYIDTTTFLDLYNQFV